MAITLDARVKQKTGTAADFAGYTLLEGEIALVRTSASGPVWNFKVGPGNFDSLDWSLQNPGAAQEADTSTVFPTGVPGLYIPTESGTYEGVTVDLSSGYTQLIWDGATLTDVVFPIDLAGYAKESDIDNNLLDSGIIISGELINTTGLKATVAGWEMVRVNATPGAQYTIGRIYITTSYNLAFYDSSDDYIPGSVTVSVPSGGTVTVTAPAGTAYLYVNLKRPTDDDSVYATAGIFQGAELLPYEISVILGKELAAKVLLPENEVPDPSNAMSGVNRRYLQAKGVVIDDIIDAPNLFPGGIIVEGQLINASGAKQSVAGWKMVRVSVSPDTDYSITNIHITTSYTLAFYDSGDNYIAGTVAITPTGDTATVQSPASAAYLYVNLKRPTDDDSVYLGAAIWSGIPEITHIKGVPVKASGESYDQSLNTFDNVEFANVKVNGMELDLPTGATEPGGLSIGDAWVDTANGNVIKVKLV